LPVFGKFLGKNICIGASQPVTDRLLTNVLSTEECELLFTYSWAYFTLPRVLAANTRSEFSFTLKRAQ